MEELIINAQFALEGLKKRCCKDSRNAAQQIEHGNGISTS